MGARKEKLGGGCRGRTPQAEGPSEPALYPRYPSIAGHGFGVWMDRWWGRPPLPVTLFPGLTPSWVSEEQDGSGWQRARAVGAWKKLENQPGLLLALSATM